MELILESEFDQTLIC